MKPPFRTRKQEARARADWLQWVERLVVTTKPELAGRMDWDTAIYLWNSGADTETAAERLIALLSAR